VKKIHFLNLYEQVEQATPDQIDLYRCWLQLNKVLNGLDQRLVERIMWVRQNFKKAICRRVLTLKISLQDMHF
jgi:hypothetical protein